ncbi:MAG TPA: hypothetical protein VHJ99_09915 [Candidatus Dormibacteraeota bacterium]|nr:hypothetical protein [Candidatus Dormibacteraeota bacterium]
MRNALLVLLVFLIAACGAYRLPGASSGIGTVSGMVVAIPCSPIQPAQKACAGRPVPELEIGYVNGGTTAKAVTDSNGKYSVDLSSGTWQVTLRTSMRVISGPLEVTVSAGGTLTANYVLDSGMRIPTPIPQQ